MSILLLGVQVWLALWKACLKVLMIFFWETTKLMLGPISVVWIKILSMEGPGEWGNTHFFLVQGPLDSKLKLSAQIKVFNCTCKVDL